MIFALLTAAFYILLFSNFPGFELITQLTAIGLIGVACLTAIVQRRMINKTLSITETMLFLAGFLSLLVSYLNSNYYSLPYSAIYILLLIEISLLSRTLAARDFLASAALAYILMLATIVAFDGNGLVASLSNSTGPLRFRPFGLHPNLSGFIFGGGAILLAFRAHALRGLGRLVHAMAATLCVAIVLASSARAALLAIVVSLALWSVLRINRLSANQLGAIAVSAIVGVIVVAINFEPLYSYFSVLLDLQSSARGLESGGSGRLALWQQGLELLASRGFELIIGSGLRSSAPEIIGFSTENSYITILLDSGILVGGLLIVTIALITLKSGRIIGRSDRQPSGNAGFVVLLYVMIQSLFNRYLIAIGNPLSLLELCLLIKVASSTVGVGAGQPALNAIAATRGHRWPA